MTENEHVCDCIYMQGVSQEECARLRKNVPYVKVHRYNPKHLYPKLNGYGDFVCVCACACVFLLWLLLMKHAPLPRVILHAIGIQLDWCWFTVRFCFRGYSDQHHPMSAVTAFPLQSLCIVSYSLMGICISLYSSLKFRECYQFLFACWPVRGSLDICLE